MSQQPRKSLKGRIEDNIIIAILSAGMAAGTVTAGVVEFLNLRKEQVVAEKHDMQIEELKSRIAAVTRSLGGQEKLDVRKMLIEEVEIQAAATAQNTKYFPDGRYCVIDSIDGLTYRRTTEAKLIAQMLGQKDIPKTVAEAMDTVAADVWEGIIMPMSNGPFQYVFPFVAVELVKKDKLGEIALKFGKTLEDDDGIKDKTNEQKKLPSTDNRGNEDFRKYYNQVTADNSAAFYLASILVSLYSSHLDVNVRRIEQVGPLMYMQAMIKLKNVNVNKVDYPIYYIIKEYFLVARNDSLFVITTQIPTDNPTVGNAATVAINEWLSSFRLAAF
jgi:hypothetical protein